MGFLDNMRAILNGQSATQTPPLGLDPATGSGPMTPEAADPTTPSPSGQVLARLVSAQQAPPPGGDNSPFGGVGGGALAGLKAYQPGMSHGLSLAAGFAAGLQAAQDRADKNDALAEQAKTRNLAALKTLFDASRGLETDAQSRADTAFNQDLATKKFQQDQAKEAAAEARQSGQDAETKRWHDILGDYYKGIASGKSSGAGKELTADQLSLAAKRAADQAGYQPGKQGWTFLDDAEKSQRFKKMANIYKGITGKDYPVDEAGNPLAPAPAATNAKTASGQNPTSPGVKPRHWVAATAPDGTRWLIDQNSGERQPINTAQPYAGAPAAPVQPDTADTEE